MFSLAFILLIITNVDADGLYESLDTCVFNALQVGEMESKYHCALRCEVTNCTGFQYDKDTSNCILYDNDGICPSNNNCPNVTIFINSRDNDAAKYKSARYSILNGITFNYSTGEPSIFSITNMDQAIPIYTGDRNGIIIATGIFNSSRLIIFPKTEIVSSYFENKDPKFSRLANNCVSYLTGGQCNDYLNCYHPISSYSNYLGKNNQVFGIDSYSSFDLQDLKNQMLSNNWHFILSGTFWTTNISKIIQDFMNLYGLCATNSIEKTDWFINGNICQNISTVAQKQCQVV